LTRVALHLVAGAATVGCFYPLIGRRQRLAIKQRWSRQLLDMLGVGLDVRGAIAGAMKVANHVSWLDIFAINAISPAAFIAKDDVRTWPLIGWMSAQTDTIYIRRGSRRAAHDATHEVAEALKDGIDVVAFPEGTTSDGRDVLPFHGALLQGAIMSGTPIQPVALRYQTGEEQPAQAPVYCGETSLLGSMWHVATASGLAVRLEFLPVLDSAGRDRRELAARLRDDIVAVMLEFRPHVRPAVAA
jgi:1-acyl-sn-glycerol-3-phosphate acyltransferase